LEVPEARFASQVKQPGCITLLVVANFLISLEVGHWMLMSLRPRRVKTGSRLLKQACYS
jgi:hypothetical protein